jgi:hypothetical protein
LMPEFSIHWIRTAWIPEASHSSSFGSLVPICMASEWNPFPVRILSSCGEWKTPSRYETGKIRWMGNHLYMVLGYELSMAIVHWDYIAVTPSRDANFLIPILRDRIMWYIQ